MAISKWHLALAASATCALFVVPIAEASTYTVQSGDSLYKIAQKYNITVNDLKAWNNLSTNNLYVNQSLIVALDEVASPLAPSENGTTLTTSIIQPTTVGSKLKTYRVVKGDTLTKIATTQNTTVAKLKEWNNLSSDLIKINQVLIVKKDSVVNSNLLTGNKGNAGGGSSNSGNPNGENNSTIPNGQAPNNSPEQTEVDKMIKAQLASETPINASPSVSSLKKYDELIALAKTFIGVPYVFGGNTPAGFDCSGFISYVYNKAGIQNTRRSSLDYFLKDTTTVKVPVPGDLVFFKNTYIPTISHMGIYLGNGEMIHAGSKGIEVTKLSYQYWSDRQVAFKRFKNVK